MKLLKFIVLYLSMIATMSCAKEDNNTCVILITYNYGDGQHHAFIGSDDKSIDSSYQNDHFLKESIEEFYGADRHIIKSDALNYLAEYVNRNCHTVDENTRKALASYTIRSYSKGSVQKCYYYDKDEIVKYFEGMIAWLEKSPYKHEYKGIIKQLQLYIKTRKP